MEQFWAEQGRDAASQIVPLQQPDVDSVLSVYDEIQDRMRMELRSRQQPRIAQHALQVKLRVRSLAASNLEPHLSFV